MPLTWQLQLATKKISCAVQTQVHPMSQHAPEVAEVSDNSSTPRLTWTGVSCILKLLPYLAQHCPISIGHNGCVDHVMHTGKSWDLLDLQGAGTMSDCHRLESVQSPDLEV